MKVTVFLSLSNLFPSKIMLMQTQTLVDLSSLTCGRNLEGDQNFSHLFQEFNPLLIVFLQNCISSTPGESNAMSVKLI